MAETYDSWSEFLESTHDWNQKENFERIEIEKCFLIADLPVTFIRSPLPAIGDEVPNKELVNEILKAARLLLTALWEEERRETGRGGKNRGEERTEARQMERFECHSALSLHIDLEQQTVGLKLKHLHHKAHENTELTPAVKDFVMQRIFSATADDIYKELMKVEDTVAGAKHVRQRQVYHLWSKGNKAAKASESVPDKGEASPNESVLDNGEADNGEANAHESVLDDGESEANESFLNDGEANALESALDNGEATANESVLDNDNGESDKEGSVANVSDGESDSQDEGDDDSEDEDNGDITVKDSFQSKSSEERMELTFGYMRAIVATGNVQLIDHVEECLKEAFAFASAIYDYKRKGRMDITRARNVQRVLEYYQE